VSNPETRARHPVLSDRRAHFFLGAAVLCAALAPLADAELRWVPVALAAVYVVLALLSMLDRWSADHETAPDRPDLPDQPNRPVM
jgi:hypothetical protein